MRKRLSQITTALGIAMLLGGALLLAHNAAEAEAARDQSAVLLAQIKEQVPQTTAAVPLIPEASEPVPMEKSMPVVLLDSIGCAGTLSIPCLNLELPVIHEWSYEALQKAPCRYSGSLETDDLVICGHSYSAHFGRLNEIPPGSELIFTTMDAIPHRYQAVTLEQLEPTAIEEMTAGSYPLTLFSCTPDGRKRVALRCSMIME